ncbi:hypothetical protein [Shewanella algae]|uniref:hypothetical protein n=1 Tax=Shewanella algae TaxID=38313 RepID=UPI001BEFB3FD|nr:hypothetical protein [Shewanella algae]BCV40844.1 hypothetical protein TUM17378_21060 [Shewanella algae]
MIITQQIINGVCSVTKTGSYFNLISAAGVVRVKLTKNGSTVLDSKMWVGMNLDKAQPFDEVEIYGADGPIEFWAGDVSMTQNGKTTIVGAAAVRSSVVEVLGKKLLTQADLTRSSIRIRTNKDIFIGGVGVNGVGWRVAANTTEEIPLSGSVYGYRTPPELDLDGTEVGARDAAMWPAQPSYIDFMHVSDDEQVKFASSIDKTFIKVGAADWQEHDFFLNEWNITKRSFFYNRAKGIVYCLARFDQYGYNIYKSEDDCQTWQKIGYLNYYELCGSTRTDFQIRNLYMVGNLLSVGASSVWIAYNVETKEAFAANREDNPGQYYFGYSLCWLDAGCQTGFEITSGVGNTGKVFRKTTDGGQNWSDILTSVEAFNVDTTGQYFWVKKTDNSVYMSDDFGETFKAPDASQSKSSTKHAIYVANGVFATSSAGNLRAYYTVGDKVRGDQFATDAASAADGNNRLCMTNLGALYRGSKDSTFAQTEGNRFQIDIRGDLSPAYVEILELLA